MARPRRPSRTRTSQHGGGAVTLLAVLLPQAIQHGQYVVESDLIGPRERSAWIVQPKHHAGVDVLCAAHAFTEREGALVDHLADDSLEHAAGRGLCLGVSAALGRIRVRGSVGIVRVVVVAAPALAAVASRGDIAGGDRGRAPARLAEALLVEALGYLKARVDPDEVHQLERTHAKAALDAHDPVDRLNIRDLLLQESKCLQPEWTVAAVNEEAGPILRLNDRLAHRLARRVGASERALVRLLARDDLEQAHQRGGVEEVHADHALWVGDARGDRGDRQRGGVAGQDTLGRDDLREARVQLVLELESLGRGLDHQLALGHRLERVDGLDPRGGRIGLLGAQLAFGGFLGQSLARASGAALERLDERVVQERAGARAGGELSDAGAHRAGAEHADYARRDHLSPVRAR